MNPLIWLAAGALLGWLACVELAPSIPGHRVVNVLAGAFGACIAGWTLSAALGPDVTMAGELSVGNLMGAAFGAVVLLVLVNLVRLIRMP
jgi:uncharacterized membrane protein YeaQ/YmgE (transglycosylase-associated protein family)